MSYPLYLFFGILPSIIWLLFYLRRDAHPESNRMVLKIFFYGILAALPAILLEMGILGFLQELKFSPSLLTFLNIFIGVALIEEFLKYLVVREKVLDHPEFDEPIDIMLYMIIAALGFAAAENILILFSLGPVFLLGNVFTVSLLRFWGATFLHALCSGSLGYFWALAIFETKKGKNLLAIGLIQAVVLHGLYNFSIMELSGKLSFLIPIAVLVYLAIFLYFSFKKLKKIKSVCKI
ncbi:MAG TPA: PrsW family intramembrane metalloprotease [Patescibacteria group bacterium]|nr:PrsW family intramembrane metalloprotease [Patescibacteria group bacterium]